ncbi:MAG: hypothetical protein E6H04_13225 [Bacillati bacterium ANGP1]|uniref:DUF7948 domain-containing protein n=1 Tax=Candidatus Segetimicrobium genomatis TaxID=2569760 RepID=A0A537J372_9BACT|nr:MAG: hypothetical protein E6H04_13225 [Terrabacteria group bacterium ANGP1]
MVHPGADPSAIALEFTGAEALDVTAQGDLVLQMRGGATVRQLKPLLYQETNGVRHDIAGRFVRKAAHQIGFQVSAYDRRQPLVIDPAYEAYSTYLGGSGTDVGRGIAVDASGNAYVTGQTNSTDFPTTSEGFQRENRGDTNAFVTKLNADGSNLVYSTYLGGSAIDTDVGRAIAVDADGNAYVTGNTYSNDFPTTPYAYQQSLGGSADAFVTKLSPDGSALVYSTYLGGSDYDAGYGIAVGPSGCAYVIGVTSSANFPLNEAYQTTFGGIQDAFVTKLSADGSALVYSTYLGGSMSDAGRSIAVFTDTGSGLEYAFVTGQTSSPDFPTTPLTAYQTAPPIGGAQSAFVTVFSAEGSALVYSTYLAGIGYTFGRGIAVDGSANAYVTGATNSLTFPVKPNPGAYQTTNHGGYDAFVAKLDPTAAGDASLVYSTYLGGTLYDKGRGIAVDGAGNAYVTGRTFSNDFPTMQGFQSYQGAPGVSDAFVTMLNADGTALVYSTYLAGTGDDLGRAIVVDGWGNAYVTGSTFSRDFPTTQDAYQVTPHGLALAGDAFVTKITQAQPSCNSPCGSGSSGSGGSGGAPADPPALPTVPSLPSVP